MTVAEAIHQMPLAVALRGGHRLYLAVSTLHLAAIALLFGSIVIVDLRILGLSRQLSVRQLSRHALPWTMLAFLIAVTTGSLLFIAHADELVNNRVFISKLGLISLAAVNAAIFHTGSYVKVADWDSERAPPAGAKLCAGLSILIWCGVIACGRAIAYS
jgi:hypothetical protein